MNLNTLIKFHNDLTLLDDSKITVVNYDSAYSLTYRQLNVIVRIPYMDNYYFHNKFELGILMPNDLKELKSTLELMIQDPKLNSGDLNASPKEFSTVVYSLVKGLVGPQVIYKLNYLSFTKTFISKFILLRSGTESRILLKLLNNERRKSKNHKSIQNSSTS